MEREGYRDLKVIYVFERRHGYSSDFEMFQMDSFTSKGYDVEVWSAVNWTFSAVDKPVNCDNSGRTHYIDDKANLKRELYRIRKENCIFLIYPYHAYNYISYVIRKEIKRAGFAFCNITESPGFSQQDRIESMISSYSTRSICLKELRRTISEIGKIFLHPILCFLYKARGKETPNFRNRLQCFWARFWGPIWYKSLYNFVTVELLYNYFPNYFEVLSNRNRLIHSESYDEYISIKEQPPLLQQDYVVYVDDYAVGHSDFVKRKIPFPVSDANNHFKHLNALFDKIEQDMNLEVIIAAHPKAEYKGDEFQGRKIIYFKTNYLIKDAKLVIIGRSTCLGTMLLFKKDFILAYSSEYFQNVPVMEGDYNKLAQLLDCQMLDILNEKQIGYWKDYVVYSGQNINETYVKRYIKSDSATQEKKVFEIIRDALEERNK